MDDGLAEKTGYAHARDFFAAVLKAIPQSTLSRYGLVAQSFGEAIAKKYGMSKLELLLAYEGLAHTAATSADPGAVQVNAPQKDGSTKAKAFQDCSVSELNLAIKQLKGGGTPLPAPDAARVAKLQAADEGSVGPHGHVQVTAKIRGRTTYYSVDHVPSAQLAAVLDALRSA